jgi:hypothetical protein
LARRLEVAVRILAVVALSVVALVAGTVALVGGQARPRIDSVVLPEVPAGSVVAPVRLTVPSVGVDTGLTRLGADAAGRLVLPDDFAVAGWFAAGPAPGTIGPAVLAGHVDSVHGPAVFHRLGEVPVESEVLVGREDGTTARFTVTQVQQYPKDAFSTAEVYGPTAGAELRLITCGGAFDRTQRSYVDKVVVYAHLAS